jgi:hypothetical protein
MKSEFTEMKLVDGAWTEIGIRPLTGGFSIFPSGIPEAPARISIDEMHPKKGIVGQEETYSKETSEELQGYA